MFALPSLHSNQPLAMSGTLPAAPINWQCTPSQLEVKPKSTGNLLTTREDRALEIGADGHSKAAEDQKLRDPHKALPYAQKTVERGGNNKAFEIDTLARVHFMLGDVDKAIDLQKKAIALAPDRETYQKALKEYEDAKAHRGRNNVPPVSPHFYASVELQTC